MEKSGFSAFQFSKKIRKKIFGVYLALTVLCLSQTTYSQINEWNSMTHRRVNLRENATIQSAIIVTLDEWTQVTVISEAPDWYNVRLQNGTTGWIAQDYVVSQSTLENLFAKWKPETETKQTELQPDKPEFTTEKEPKTGTALFKGVSEPSFLAAHFDKWHLNIFIPLIFGLSFLVNIFVFYWIKASNKLSKIPYDPEKLKNKFNLLKKEHEDQRNKLNFSREKVTALEKTVQKYEKDLQLQKELHSREFTEHKNKFNVLEESHNKNIMELRERK